MHKTRVRRWMAAFSKTCVRGCAVACFASAHLGASAMAYQVDSVRAERNGVLLFEDHFNDGLAPPNGPVFVGTSLPGYTSTRMVGDFSGAEAGGKLALDPSLRGVATVNPFTGLPEGLSFMGLYLNVNTDGSAAAAERGLKLNHRFEFSAVFDLITPGPVPRFDSYGLRLADFDNPGATGWNDVLDLQVIRGATTGGPVLVLTERDVRAGTRTTLEFAVLDSQLGDQIELRFSKDVVDDPTVHAGFRYLSGGVASPFQSFAASSDLFDGEVFTRPGLIAVASLQPVPEPSAWAMMALGLVATLTAARRRRH